MQKSNDIEYYNCNLCKNATDGNLLEISPFGDHLLCPNCYQIQSIKYEKSNCFKCNPKVHSRLADICSDCRKDGWNVIYDNYDGKLYLWRNTTP